MTLLVLPIPPSANNLFLNNSGRRGGRRVSPAYSAWRWDALVAIKAQDVAPIVGAYRLRLRLPQTMRGDISNRIKAVEDFLVAQKITSDDRHNCHVSAERDESVEPGTCVVEIGHLNPKAIAGAQSRITERTGAGA